MLNIADPTVVNVFHRMVTLQMNLQPGEEVLLAADFATEPETIQAMVNAVHSVGATCTVALQPNTGFDSSDKYALTSPMKDAYMGADVVIVAGRASSATLYGRPQAYRDKLAAKQGTRMFSIVERPFGVLVADNADYTRIREVNEKLKTLFARSQEIRIIAPNGTDFKGGLQGVDVDHLWGGLSHDGFSLEPGAFGACPDGEVHWPCPPETMEGVVVVDGPVANICHRPDQPIRLTVKRGRITRIEGGDDAQRLSRFIAELEQDYTAEIGMGTNPVWTGWSDSLHSIKKGLGNLHVAYGGWWGFQPTIPYRIHGDMVIFNGRVEVDGKVVMADAQLLLD